MLTVEQAVQQILAAASPLGIERAQLLDTAGRVLAEDVVSHRTLPPWDNSAMDGYAARAAEVTPGAPLPVAFTVAAGASPPPLPAGHAARIMTGAPVPDGADAVIMREDADEQDGVVRFRLAPRPGAHIRRAGEDVTAGAVVLASGTPIGPGEIGLLASLGRTLIAVRRRPRVAIVSTGDELVEPDRPPGPGQIVGSNAWALAAQVAEAGALPHVMPIARDDRAVIRDAFAAALEADVVISSGGVSVGEFDFVKVALDDLGVVQGFWKVDMKPGKPITFGTKGTRPVFGLPGNPASSMVGFELFVRPALLRLAGHAEVERPRARVILDEPYRYEGGRRHFVRAALRRDRGLLFAKPNPRQGSGMLRSMVGVNALLDIAGAAGAYDAGAEVTAILLRAV